MSDPKMQEAARTLQEWMLERSPHSRGLFSIGMGADELHVYVQCSARRWGGEHAPMWAGVPVQWHWDVGPAKAYAT